MPGEMTGPDVGLPQGATSVTPPSFMANPLCPGIDPRPPLTDSLKIGCPKSRSATRTAARPLHGLRS